jgi:hypothetical protein
MKKKLFVTSIALCTLFLHTFAGGATLFEQKLQPFIEDNWAGNHRTQAQVFNSERERLGDWFIPELMDLLKDDVATHYWISLTSEYYLENVEPMPQLGLLLMEQGLVLSAGKKEYAHYAVSFHVNAAVLSQKIGLPHLALSHKEKAEKMVGDNSDLAGAWPAMSKNDREIYDSIKRPSKPQRVKIMK